jgi:hypothetical protein
VFTKLLGLDYKIVYKKATENRMADALSRMLVIDDDKEQISCMAISSSQPKWLQEVALTYETDVKAKELITKLTIDQHAMPHYT